MISDKWIESPLQEYFYYWKAWIVYEKTLGRWVAVCANSNTIGLFNYCHDAMYFAEWIEENTTSQSQEIEVLPDLGGPA